MGSDHLNSYFKKFSPQPKTVLIDYLNKSAELLKQAEHYNMLPELLKLAAAIHDPRDYQHLKQIYQNIEAAYALMSERDKQQKQQHREEAAYYRVCFHGRLFAEENQKCFIYKEKSHAKLYEICERLRQDYAKQVGEQVEIVNDDRKWSELQTLDGHKSCIQVTFVQPYFNEDEDHGQIMLEKNSELNIHLKRFFYETCFHQNLRVAQETQEKIQHDELLTLCKRKVILESRSFYSSCF